MAKLLTLSSDEHFDLYVEGYTLVTMIDYGSFGDVFKVVNQSSKRVYALKQIRFKRDFQDDPYIINELYCLTHLSHRNIVKLNEIVIQDGEINVIMEYASNENLERYLTRNSFVETHKKYTIYSQILEGVKYCHSMDIAHRDLTPSNILLSAEMVVKLADFGLAVRCFTDDDEPVICTDYLGHASFLAPEILAHKPFLPKPADIWSLGITLLYILFQETPYQGFEQEILEDQFKHSWKEFLAGKARDQKFYIKEGMKGFINSSLKLDPMCRSDICDLVRSWHLIDK